MLAEPYRGKAGRYPGERLTPQDRTAARRRWRTRLAGDSRRLALPSRAFRRRRRCWDGAELEVLIHRAPGDAASGRNGAIEAAVR